MWNEYDLRCVDGCDVPVHVRWEHGQVVMQHGEEPEARNAFMPLSENGWSPVPQEPHIPEPVRWLRTVHRYEAGRSY